MQGKCDLFILGHELGVELDDPIDPVRAGCKEGRAEVEGALLLPKTGARDHANARCIEEAQAVEFVGRPAFGSGGFDGLGG